MSPRLRSRLTIIPPDQDVWGYSRSPRRGWAARAPHEQTALERQIAATDTQIDRLVYQLYLPAPCPSRQAGGLTEEQIKIVEGTAP